MNVPWGNGRFARVLVYGLGLSGKAAARFLLARGVSVLAIDARPAAGLDLGDLAAHPGPKLAKGEPASVPAEVDADGVKAVYRNGILTVTLPKTPQLQPRAIPVTSGS